MKNYLLPLLFVLSACSQSPAELQSLHAKGQCGTLTPGTGLTWWPDGTVRGEVTSMLPGITFFRMRGAGTVTLTLNKLDQIDFKPQDFKTVVIEGADRHSVLEWKSPLMKNWERVPTAFLYPRVITQAQIDVDNALKYNLPIPGVGLTGEQLKNPKRLVPDSTPIHPPIDPS